ncbi:type IV pilus modification protein PilV [Methylocaldum gracile subsp. desertum]|uniref:type IV pilus modification protein PilV n=1 Tax=Methylocaldum sp. GT1BW TaxID=3438964 RepID=UPI003DA0D608
MLEVLISVLVFSIGVLGIAALQLKAKQSGYEAVQRTIASSLAAELLERMRLNSSGTSLINYVTAAGTQTINSTTATTLFASTPDCSAACTSTQLATYDLSNFWNALIGTGELRGTANTGGLVNPTVCINGPATGTPGTYTVTIAWRGQADLAWSNQGVNASTCGQGSYDGPSGTNGYRRILSITTWIGP